MFQGQSMSLNERNSIEWLQTDAGRALAWKLAFFVPLLICLVSVWSPVPPTSVWWTASGLLLLVLMATISVTDLLWCRIPNWATYSAFAWGLAINAYASTAGDESLRQSLGAVGLQQSLLGALIPFGVMLVIFSLTGGGAGDVKLFAALGTLLGPGATAMAFLYTAVAGGALAVIVAMSRRTLAASLTRTAALVRTGGAAAAEIEHPSAPNRFAYAPAIAIGTFVAALGL